MGVVLAGHKGIILDGVVLAGHKGIILDGGRIRWGRISWS
jgi:hypothetical protein